MTVREVESPRRRAAWALADQILSTTTNFGLSVIVARRVTTTEYGAFAVGFTVYALMLGISRALSTDPLIVRFSDRSHDDQREAAGTAVAIAIAIGASVGAIVVVGGLAVGPPLRSVLVVFGLGLPLLLWQDAYRYQFIAARRPQLAALNDLAWVAVLAPLLVLTVRADVTTAAPFVAVWAGAAGAAAILAMGLLRATPRFDRGREWLRHHSDINVRFALEFVLLTGGPQLVLLAVAAISGYAEAGGVRGASVLLGPATVLAAGAVIAMVPEGVRLKDRDLARLRRVIDALAVMLGVFLVAWGAIASQLPTRVGTALLGNTWPHAKEIVFPLGLAAAGVAASTGVATGLRSLAAGRQILKATIPAVGLLVVGGVAGALIDQGVGAAIGMIVPAWIGCVLYRVQFRRVLRAASTEGVDSAIA